MVVVPRSRRGVGGGGSISYVILRFLKALPFLAIMLYFVMYSMNGTSDSLFDEGGSGESRTLLRREVETKKVAQALPETNDKQQQWQSKNSAVLALATNMHIDDYQRFVVRG